MTEQKPGLDIFRRLEPFEAGRVLATPRGPGIYIIETMRGESFYVRRSRIDIHERPWRHLQRTGSRKIEDAINQGMRLEFEYEEMTSVEQAVAILIQELGTLQFGNLGAKLIRRTGSDVSGSQLLFPRPPWGQARGFSTVIVPWFGQAEKKKRRLESASRRLLCFVQAKLCRVWPAQYIPPPIPPPPGGIAGAFSSSGISATKASVVNIRPAIEDAFCSAVRATLAGSMTPSFTRSP